MNAGAHVHEHVDTQEDLTSVTSTPVDGGDLADDLTDGYTGPVYRRCPDGTRVVRLGRRAGGGHDVYVAVDQGGVRGGLVTGRRGSGKSWCVELIARGLRSGGEWAVLAATADGDPRDGRGRSAPRTAGPGGLAGVADWAVAGPAGALAQLRACEAVLTARGRLKATLTADRDGAVVALSDPEIQQPLRCLQPSPAHPGLMWVLDGLHLLADDPGLRAEAFVARLERVVRMGRRYGLAVLAATNSLLAGDYGGSTTLRGDLAARNLFAGRSDSYCERVVFGHAGARPCELPPGGGYFLTGDAVMRTADPADPGAWSGRSATSPVVLDPDTAAAIAAHRDENRGGRR